MVPGPHMSARTLTYENAPLIKPKPKPQTEINIKYFFYLVTINNIIYSIAEEKKLAGKFYKKNLFTIKHCLYLATSKISLRKPLIKLFCKIPEKQDV